MVLMYYLCGKLNDMKQGELRKLHGKMSELENTFIKNKNIKNRQEIIRIFDDCKRDVITDKEAIEKLTKLIK